MTGASALVVGSIVGVGIFNLPSALAGYGPITLISMGLATVGALALARLFASLSRRMPADGGPYAYARVAFGNRLGFADAWSYWTVVVDHDTGRLVWAHPGRDRKTVEKFLDLLGKERCHQLKLVSCDMATWITAPVAERCPNASVCYDPFHLIALATDARDEIRREVWNDARRQGQAQIARELKGARFALWKNPHNLTARQQLKLARVQQLNQRLDRAYLLAQQLRQIYRVGFDDAIALLDAWIAWARRCRMTPFVKLARTITEQRVGIESALRHGLSNARVEQVNTQIRLITRRAFGFHSPHAAIALAMLARGGLCPSLPGR